MILAEVQEGDLKAKVLQGKKITPMHLKVSYRYVSSSILKAKDISAKGGVRLRLCYAKKG